MSDCHTLKTVLVLLNHILMLLLLLIATNKKKKIGTIQLGLVCLDLTQKTLR